MIQDFTCNYSMKSESQIFHVLPRSTWDSIHENQNYFFGPLCSFKQTNTVAQMIEKLGVLIGKFQLVTKAFLCLFYPYKYIDVTYKKGGRLAIPPAPVVKASDLPTLTKMTNHWNLTMAALTFTVTYFSWTCASFPCGTSPARTSSEDICSTFEVPSILWELPAWELREYVKYL